MSYWAKLPAPILLQVIYSLDIKSVLQVRCVCRRWSNFAQGDAVWRRLFARRWKKQRERTCNKRQLTWMEEYKRLESFSSLRRRTLAVDGEAWFLTFSRDGKKMATSTRAGSAFLWSLNEKSLDKVTSIACNLEQRVSIHGGFECHVCTFSPDSRLLLLTAVNVGVPIHAAGTAFVLDTTSSMEQLGSVHELVFHLTSAMAWIDDRSFVGCKWDPVGEIIYVNVYSPMPTMTTRQLCCFDCGSSKAIKSVVHIRVYTLDGGKQYHLLAVVCPDQPNMSLHLLWSYKWSIRLKKSSPLKLTFDVTKMIDLNCLVCAMEMTPSYKRLVTVCTPRPKNANMSIRDVQVKVFDPQTLACLQSLPSCALTLKQCHLFVGVNEDYVACGDESGTVIVWDLFHEIMVCELKGHKQFVNAVAWHPTLSGVLATSSDDNSVSLWHS